MERGNQIRIRVTTVSPHSPLYYELLEIYFLLGPNKIHHAIAST